MYVHEPMKTNYSELVRSRLALIPNVSLTFMIAIMKSIPSS